MATVRLRYIFPVILVLQVLCLSVAYAETVVPHELVVGVSLPLTGKLAAFGVAEQHGLEMAADEINQGGGSNGYRVRLVFDDNLGEPKAALNGVIKLLEADKADVIFSAFTHITYAVKDIVASHQKVLIYAATAASIAKENPLFFMDYLDGGKGGRVLAELMQSEGYNRVAIISESNEASRYVEEAFRNAIGGGEPKVVWNEEYTSGANDFTAMLLRMKSKSPQAFLACTFKDNALLLRQLKQLKMLGLRGFYHTAPFLPEADTPEMRAMFEENRAVSTWYGYAEGDLEPQQKVFIEKFQSRYRERPRSDVLYAYDDIMALYNSGAGCFEGERIEARCLAQQLLNYNARGVAGVLTFDPDRVARREVFAVEVKNGLWTKVR